MRRTFAAFLLALAGIVVVPVALSTLRSPSGLTASGVASPSPSMTESKHPLTATASPTPGAGWASWLWERFDPATLEPQGEALELGMPEHSAVSPDGRTLASLTYRTDGESLDMEGRGRLQLVDVNQWTVKATAEVETLVPSRQYGIIGEGALMAFVGEDLLWLEEIPGDEPQHSYRFRFWRNGSSGPEDGPLLPRHFQPWDLALLTDGFAVFGLSHTRTDNDDVWEAQARIVAFDRDSATPKVDVALDDISAGWSQTDGEPHTSHPGLAWDLKREIAYVVDANKATAVDLRAGRAETASLAAPTVASRLLDFLAPVAHAKSAEGVSLNADLAPDGSRLYVSGVRTELLRNDRGELTDVRHVPLGLRVIDTDSLRQTAEVDLPVSDVRVAPDGTVLLTGVTDRNTILRDDPRRSGLYILGADLTVRHHILDGAIVHPRYFPAPDQVAITFFPREPKSANVKILDLTDASTIAEHRRRLHSPEGLRAGFLARWTTGDRG